MSPKPPLLKPLSAISGGAYGVVTASGVGMPRAMGAFWGQQRRDTRDRTRGVGPLVQAADATEVNTDGLSPQEVVDALEALVRSKLKC